MPPILNGLCDAFQPKNCVQIFEFKNFSNCLVAITVVTFSLTHIKQTLFPFSLSVREWRSLIQFSLDRDFVTGANTVLAKLSLPVIVRMIN